MEVEFFFSFPKISGRSCEGEERKGKKGFILSEERERKFLSSSPMRTPIPEVRQLHVEALSDNWGVQGEIMAH